MTNDIPLHEDTLLHAYYREKARDLPGPCPESPRKEVPAWAKDRYPTWEEFRQAIHDRKSGGW